MKYFVMAVLALATVGFQQTAFAGPAEDLYHATISGSTGLRTFATNRICEGAGGCSNCFWTSGGGDSCGAGLTYKGNDKTGSWSCCRCVVDCVAYGMEDLSAEELTVVEANEKAQEAGLSDVFAPNQSTTYWGYMNSTNRSSNNGRTTSAAARLDACLYYTDVDNLGSGYTAWDTCRTSTTLGCLATNKNEYCQANGAAVCLDRCDCTFTGFGTCDNL